MELASKTRKKIQKTKKNAKRVRAQHDLRLPRTSTTRQQKPKNIQHETIHSNIHRKPQRNNKIPRHNEPIQNEPKKSSKNNKNGKTRNAVYF